MITTIGGCAALAIIVAYALEPKMNMIFVFGSNEAGRHGAGAANVAYTKYSARWGKGYGHYGDTFAIPTKDRDIRTLPLNRIRDYVSGFLAYAKGNPDLKFKVTCIGCGLAGLHHEQIAPMFKDAPSNCLFDTAWHPWLGDEVEYWGHF